MRPEIGARIRLTMGQRVHSQIIRVPMTVGNGRATLAADVRPGCEIRPLFTKYLNRSFASPGIRLRWLILVRVAAGGSAGSHAEAEQARALWGGVAAHAFGVSTDR